MLLDLKLPVLMGLDVLRWLKEQRELQTLIVIVMTSSKDPTDIHEAYRLGARSYLVKPLSVHERLEIAKAIKSYWLGLNTLPSPIAPASRPTANG
jgi:CheY-like chemotaxis protein